MRALSKSVMHRAREGSMTALLRHRHRRLAAVLLGTIGIVAGSIVLLVGGRKADAQTNPPPASNTDVSKIYSPSTLVSSPRVLATNSIDYMFSSGIAGSDGLGPPPNAPVRSFVRMGQWLQTRDAMPTLPSWAEPGSVIGAPDVRFVGGRYVMWFTGLTQTAPSGSPMQHLWCLGWATATQPMGPYTTNASQPAFCQYSDWGDLGTRTFMVGNQEYLLWKSDDNIAPAPKPPSKIYAVKLGADGVSFASWPAVLLKNTKSWEGVTVESPDMASYGSKFYLFFSSPYDFNDVGGGIGLATCQGPLGPCSDTNKGPWLGSNTHGAFPNEVSLFQQQGALWMIYTPWAHYNPDAFPIVAVSRVAFGTHGPYVATFDGANPNP